jgi:hypothetical protein
VTRRRIQAHSNNGDEPTHVTKVLLRVLTLIRMRGFGIAAAAIGLACGSVLAVAAANDPAKKPAEALYLQLGQVGLDPSRVYQVRGATLERSAIHITLEDGTIGFTEDVMGRITGAFFEGEGEVLIVPPSDVERRSMSLFTGMAILEEHFATAYFRFNDDLATEMRPDLRAAGENKQEFVDRWMGTSRNLAQTDAMRMQVSFSRLLPVNGAPSSGTVNAFGKVPDFFLHARLQGTKLGVFDVLFDSLAAEQVEVGQAKTAANGFEYYDVWTSFSPNAPGAGRNLSSSSGPGSPSPREDWIAARRYTIHAEVQPPKQLHAHARVQLDVKEGGTRALLFELSRFLQVESVKLNGQEVEFIHNPAVEGTQLSRRGNDLVAVILPEAAQTGQKLDLEFVYGGEVLAEAGSGLLYVGARGTWYPNRGMAMADFDLAFDYPQAWTLVATGKSVPVSGDVSAAKAKGEQSSHWISERPIPLAGFNLGKYKEATAMAGNVIVETYATTGVERDFPSARIQVIDPQPSDTIPHGPQVILPSSPSPVQNEASVGEVAARAIQYYADRFGPYPYSRLALTQMPGGDSQGWPGLVFLSSYAFLNDQQRRELHFNPARIVLQQMIPAHEAAHQWWGDLITWSSYRDQWLSEGLANYCALMMVQEKDPAAFREIMEKYRRDLVLQNKDGVAPDEEGPVTLGTRLLSSRFPEGYEAITYGRGTWLFHMLRTMMKDAVAQDLAHKGRKANSADEPFIQALYRLRQRYEGKSISTREMLDVFAEDLPPGLRFENKNSLDWFLDGWINGTSLPKLELKGTKFTPKEAGTLVSGTILQKTTQENLVTSVPVYAVVAGKQMVLLGRVFADGEETQFRLMAPPGTHKIVLDPNDTILTTPK